MLNTEPQRPLARIVAGLAGLAMMGFGIGALIRRGDMFYTNWFGGLVFAPSTILLGIFTIGCAIFKPSWLAARRDTIRRKRSLATNRDSAQNPSKSEQMAQACDIADFTQVNELNITHT